MIKAYCQHCNTVTMCQMDKRVYETYKGIRIDTEEVVPVCTKCNNEVFVPEIEDKNLKKIYARYREKTGCISPEEIVPIKPIENNIKTTANSTNCARFITVFAQTKNC